MEVTYVPLSPLAEPELSSQVIHAHHAPAPGGPGPPDIECHCLGIYMLILLPLRSLHVWEKFSPRLRQMMGVSAFDHRPSL
jgi:hypothetical protein